ncbi:MAG: ADP-ribosylglycohydrolase family protein [Arcobacter sp.]|nr:ADP-ribosylglycohydrolase family protein [Arcobacter sp.]
MFDKNKVKELVLSSLVADSYSLGVHWIYDEKQLKSMDINWNNLNDAKAIWHKEKKAGEFTHYGDQTFWLYEFLQGKDSFDSESYIVFWKNKMDSYNGYIDGATRDTLANVNENISPSGSSSTDLSIIGRITPLLLVSNTNDEFLQNVQNFVKCTHNSSEALESARFFASCLLLILDNRKIEEAILELKDNFDTKIQSYIFSGIASKTDDTFTTIREFGPACDIKEGFPSVIHLVCKYDNLKDLLINNAKAGGDNSARGMIASFLFMAEKDKNLNQIPSSWLNIEAKIF